MPKYGWTNEVILLSAHQWVDLEDLMSLLNIIRFDAFSHKGSRDLIRNALENLQLHVPFSGEPSNTEESRFPSNKVFIDLSHSVPNAYLMQILSALDIADRYVEKGRDQHQHIDERSLSNFEDAKVAYYKGLYGLVDLTHSQSVERLHTVGIYTRETFESTFSLSYK